MKKVVKFEDYVSSKKKRPRMAIPHGDSLTRLTKYRDGYPEIKGIDFIPELDPDTATHLEGAIEKLALYEDLEEAGLLLLVPVKIGGIAYAIIDGEVVVVEVTGYCFPVRDLCATVAVNDFNEFYTVELDDLFMYRNDAVEEMERRKRDYAQHINEIIKWEDEP